jgi:hypothetical protein
MFRTLAAANVKHNGPSMDIVSQLVRSAVTVFV